jgi:hypothetical protein
MDEQELQRVLEAAGVPTDLTGIERIRHLATENARLAPLAADGTTYRADLVAAGVAEAVRAFGAEAGEKKRAMLLRMDLETIKEMTASWRDIGDSKLPGGRSTTNEQNPSRKQSCTKRSTSAGCRAARPARHSSLAIRRFNH